MYVLHKLNISRSSTLLNLLQVEALSSTLTSVTFDSNHIKLYKNLKETDKK